MPFKSQRQRRFMHANHPEIAQRWEHKYGSKPQPLTPLKRALLTRGRRR